MNTSRAQAWGRTSGHRWTLWMLAASALALALNSAGEDGGIGPAAGYDVRHDGLAAVEVQPRDATERALVRALAHDLWSESWTHPSVVVTLDADGQRALRAAGVELEVQIPDIQAVADAERERLRSPEASRPSDWFADYKPYAAVDAYAGRLAKLHPEVATIRQIGASVEGRAIRALWLTDASVDAAAKQTIVLNGGQHAREWISVMTTTCIADRLVHQAKSDARIAALLQQYVFVVVPIVNPDGYAYSWEHDRYWRKNRRGGRGVDLNRNWDWAWGGRGSSRNPRSQVYAGPRAFSEPETQALRDLIVAEAPVAHVDLHSFSQLILYPWASSKETPPQRSRFAAYADRMASAIYATHGKRYQTLAGADLYVASGTLSDWAYGAHDIVSFTFELRPPAKGGGFVLPPEEIVPTCEESLAAIVELAELVERDGPLP